MPIDSTELKFYRAETNADGASNGGRMSSSEIVSATPNNIFPPVTVAERTNGVTRWRKLYAKVADAENGILYLARLVMTQFTKTGDAVYFAVGGQRDTEGDLTGNEPLHGCGYLASSVAAGATSIDVTVEDGSVAIFRDGEKIHIEDGVNEEEATISGAPSVNGNTVTLPLAAGLSNGYSGGLDANGDPYTRIGSVYEAGDVQPARTTPTVTSSQGTLDESQISLSNIGTVEQDWTLTFTSATAFDLTGDTIGAAGSGTIGSDFAPDNPDFPGNPWFTIPSAAWGGTWQAGDTVTFTTHPAAVPVWAKLVVPAGTGAGQADWELLFSGESA